ncbi:MAG: hypothetical protein M3143_00770 [Actinomycetota bacterium]|nr:hypothetical protein [Actinomycetota bacterium]
MASPRTYAWAIPIINTINNFAEASPSRATVPAHRGRYGLGEPPRSA